jgi:L-threonine kinase
MTEDIYEQREKCLSGHLERVGVGKAYGTFGELLQGRLREGTLDFLVTFPIARHSYATFVSDPGSTGVSVFPPYKHKARLLANMILEYYVPGAGGRLTITSELPVGKGLASSSADLVATARAISSCFHIQLSLHHLARLMCDIEPSDGVMYPGVVAFYHRHGLLRDFIGFLPPLTIVGIDEGGELDTIQFNKLPKPFTPTDEIEYRFLLEKLSLAIRQQDISTIGQVATRSALLNQKLNPKHTIHEMIAICQEVNGLGVVVAHSGTYLGILLSSQEQHYQKQIQMAYRYFSRLTDTISLYHSLQFSS